MKCSLARLALRFGIALTLALGCAAQERNIHTTIRFTVKPDRAGDYEAAVKDFVALMKKGQSDRYNTVWQSSTSSNEFVLVRYFAKYADVAAGRDPKLNDLATELTRAGSRIQQCIERTEHRVSQVVADLSLPRPAEIPKMVRVRHTRVKPGKADEYLALLKASIMPAVKASGTKAYTTYRLMYGGSRNEIFSAMGIDGWADLDNRPSPLVKAMGEEKYRQFLTKVSALEEDNEYHLYRFRQDLSYLSSQSGGTTSGGN